MVELGYTQKRSMALFDSPFTSAMALSIHLLIPATSILNIQNGFGRLM
jgi:hypothetical protein